MKGGRADGFEEEEEGSDGFLCQKGAGARLAHAFLFRNG